MTHEDFLIRLIKGFLGEPGVPRPSYGGATLEDALCRWFCFHVAQHVLERGQFELDDRGRMAVVSVHRLWARWGRDGREDVDLRVFGRRDGRDASFDLKVQVVATGEVFDLRLADYASRQNFTRRGTRRDDGPNRVRVSDTGRPSTWTMRTATADAATTATEEVSDAPPSDVASLPPCCQRSMRTVARMIESNGALAEMVAAAPSFVQTGRPSALGLVWKLGSGAARRAHGGQVERIHRVIRPALRRQVNQVVELELLDHQPSSPAGRYWTAVHETFQE